MASWHHDVDWHVYLPFILSSYFFPLFPSSLFTPISPIHVPCPSHSYIIPLPPGMMTMISHVAKSTRKKNLLTEKDVLHIAMTLNAITATSGRIPSIHPSYSPSINIPYQHNLSTYSTVRHTSYHYTSWPTSYSLTTPLYPPFPFSIIRLPRSDGIHRHCFHHRGNFSFPHS